jgi:SAM-dependent methyltransferase
MSTGTEYWARNFYGSLRVIELPYAASRLRKLMHGTILHGSQVLQPPRRAIPTAYFGESSGIGRTLSSEHRMSGVLRIGSVGLGAGTLAAYGAPGDVFRVYEINPAVLDIARSQFDYLGDSKARVEPVLGDARISLEREVAQGAFDKPEARYDVLSLDAFSGDASPLHLLTREAFATYERVIKPDGVIAFHLSNRFLDLPPVVGQIAHHAGFQAVLVEDHPVWTPLTYGLTDASYWVLVTRNTAFLRQPDIATHSVAVAARNGLPEWTDQFTNLLQVLK